MSPLDHCRARLLVPGNPLTASLPFADPAHQDAILALRSVISEIAGIAGQVSEISVARAKLAWWQEALVSPENPHPVRQALVETEVDRHLKPDYFQPLLEGVSRSLANPRFENRNEAWQFFRAVGGAATALEARLLEPERVDFDPAIELGAAAYQIRVTRDLVIDARANRWLVPLDLQAEFQVSRQAALEKGPTLAFNGLVRTLLSEAVRQGEQAAGVLAGENPSLHRHLLIQWALEKRLATRIARRPENIFERRILPGHLGNVWQAWRAARRLKISG
jgi:15-cis-phytoene synthase